MRNLAKYVDIEPDNIHMVDMLCRADYEIFEKLAATDETRLYIGCTQEKNVFINGYSQKLGKNVPHFFNIREMAGWSAEAAQVHPKIAALMATALQQGKRSSSTPLPLYSEGITLLLGDDERVIEYAEQLKDNLNLTVLLTGKKEVSALYSHIFPVAQGQVSRLSGYLGHFELVIDNFALADPSSRDVFQFMPSRNEAHSRCDIVIDMRKASPLIASPHKRDGYIFVDPDDPIGVQKALLKAVSLVGDFEKPAYVRVEAEKCAHSRSHKNGCSRCLDTCPTGAITPNGDHIQLDPYICAGCGSCSAVCPTGAIEWAVPSPVELIREIRQLIMTYYRAGGVKAPVILLHDETHGLPLLNAMARYGKGLPAHVIPVQHPFAPAVEVLLTPLVYGASRVIMLTGNSSLLDQEALNESMTLARLILEELEYDPRMISVLDTDDPFESEEHLYAQDLLSPIMREDFMPIGTGREIAYYSIGQLFKQSRWNHDLNKHIPLPQNAVYGRIHVNEACTLCLSCVSACPASALHDGGDDRPALKFLEQNCIQCGLCQSTCPEQAINLEPRIGHPEETQKLVILKEEEPAYCSSCGVAFGTRSSIEKVVQKLSGQHSLYTDKKMIERMHMCADCRIKDHFRHIVKST